MKTDTQEIQDVLARLQALPQTPSTRQLKRGLWNTLNSLRTYGRASNAAMRGAERYLAAHE